MLQSVDLIWPLPQSSNYDYLQVRCTSAKAGKYRVQFTNPTAANAVEAQLKLPPNVTGRQSVISFTQGYHGRIHNLAVVAAVVGHQYLLAQDGLTRCAPHGRHHAMSQAIASEYKNKLAIRERMTLGAGSQTADSRARRRHVRSLTRNWLSNDADLRIRP